MSGLLIDHNCEGQFRALNYILEGPEWLSLWRQFNLPIYTLDMVQLPHNLPDRQLWRYCQQHQLVLVTANRNKDGVDSLEETLRDENRADAWPVFTLANADQINQSRAYAERVVVRLLEYLLELDQIRGIGRLYLP